MLKECKGCKKLIVRQPNEWNCEGKNMATRKTSLGIKTEQREKVSCIPLFSNTYSILYSGMHNSLS
jgi:hypothetical protein